MGTKSWVLKRTAKRGSQNWVDFPKKKRISHYVFACFVQMGSKFGVLLSTRQHIYIYIYIYKDIDVHVMRSMALCTYMPIWAAFLAIWELFLATFLNNFVEGGNFVNNFC